MPLKCVCKFVLTLFPFPLNPIPRRASGLPLAPMLMLRRAKYYFPKRLATNRANAAR